MSMEIQSFELSTENVLRLHRHWITTLYVHQRKTEVEIIDLLYERNLPVSLHQLRRLLLEWKLIRSSPSTSTTTTAARTSDLGESWEIISADEPESRDVYLQRPLPLLPKSPKESSSARVRSGKGTHGRISHAKPKIASHDRPHRRVKSPLGSGPGGSSPLEDYVMDAQTHEMIAIGLSQPRRKERACL